MKLVWSRLAVQDRQLIFEHIALENPLAAVASDREISSQLSALKDFPEMGRPGKVKGTRELVIQRTPYLAAYLLRGDEILILRVLHGAQMWPERF